MRAQAGGGYHGPLALIVGVCGGGVGGCTEGVRRSGVGCRHDAQTWSRTAWLVQWMCGGNMNACPGGLATPTRAALSPTLAPPPVPSLVCVACARREHECLSGRACRCSRFTFRRVFTRLLLLCWLMQRARGGTCTRIRKGLPLPARRLSARAQPLAIAALGLYSRRAEEA